VPCAVLPSLFVVAFTLVTYAGRKSYGFVFIRPTQKHLDSQSRPSVKTRNLQFSAPQIKRPLFSSRKTRRLMMTRELDLDWDSSSRQPASGAQTAEPNSSRRRRKLQTANRGTGRNITSLVFQTKASPNSSEYEEWTLTWTEIAKQSELLVLRFLLVLILICSTPLEWTRHTLTEINRGISESTGPGLVSRDQKLIKNKNPRISSASDDKNN
jgi:hypothetical protein